MAYDSARGVTVLYGGGHPGGPWFSDTWEWNGEEWFAVAADDFPPRVSHLAYDSAREVTVLFGGLNSQINVYYNETWEWDGNAWTQVNVGGIAPSPRITAMAYDSDRQVVVLFGGRDAGTQNLDDTWEWDGVEWTQVITEGPTPSARHRHRMAYDSARGVTVLFGGRAGNAGPHLRDTWEWDGSEWTEVAQDFSPPPRGSHALAYDSARAKTILYGGTSCGNICFPVMDDMWEWDGKQWTQITDIPMPSGRTQLHMAYDSTRNTTVLFGGYGDGGPFLGDTWEHTCPSCPADLTGNNSVGVPDLLELLSQWGPCADPQNCPADLTGNGSVGVPDLLELLSQWGPCP